jgi:hypothetical protein
MALKPIPAPGFPKPSNQMVTGGSTSFDERTGTYKPDIKPVTPPTPGAAFNKYAAGAKHYGTGRNAPNVGITPNKTGYAQRDAAAAARKNALLRRSSGGM